MSSTNYGFILAPITVGRVRILINNEEAQKQFDEALKSGDRQELIGTVLKCYKMYKKPEQKKALSMLIDALNNPIDEQLKANANNPVAAS